MFGRLLILCLFICGASASKSMLYKGGALNGWVVNFIGIGREPDYGYMEISGEGTIYTQSLQGQGIKVNRTSIFDVTSFKRLNFGVFWPSTCTLTLNVYLGNSGPVFISNMTTASWNDINIDLEEFNITDPNIFSITILKADAISCNVWMSNIYFNNHNETIDGDFTTSPLPVSTSPLTSGFVTTKPITTGSTTSSTVGLTGAISGGTTDQASIPCATNLYAIYDSDPENGWSVDYFSGSGRYPDGQITWDGQNTVNFLVQQWGGLTLRREDNSYIDVSAYNYLNLRFYWEDSACNFTIRTRIKQTGEKWGLYIDYTAMKSKQWNQLSIPMAPMNLVAKTANQIEIQKTDLIACNAYVAQIEFGDGQPCDSASTMSFSFFVLLALLGLCFE